MNLQNDSALPRPLLLGMIAFTVLLVLYGTSAGQNSEETASSVAVPSELERPAPASGHLRAAHAAAGAVFAAQRSATDDPGLLELREGLAEVRESSERLSKWRSRVRRPRFGVAHADGTVGPIELESPETNQPSPAERAAESDLRSALAVLAGRIRSAQSRVGASPRSNDLLRQAIEAARRVEVDASEAIITEGGWSSRDLRRLAARLTERRLGEGEGRSDADESTADDSEAELRKSPTLTIVNRYHRHGSESAPSPR